MALPKLSSPQFITTLPSTGQEIHYRAFVVREEKILLMASESKDPKSVSSAILQVLQTCIQTENVKVDQLPFFDVEYLFLKVRARSVGETTKLSFKHIDGKNRAGDACLEITEVSVNLDEVAPPQVTKEQHILSISPTMQMVLRYPTLNEILLLTGDQKTSIDPTKIFDLLAGCLMQVIDGDEVFMPDTRREALQFIESLPHAMMESLNVFFNNVPTLTTSVTYTCEKCQQQDTVVLSGMKDFF